MPVRQFSHASTTNFMHIKLFIFVEYVQFLYYETSGCLKSIYFRNSLSNTTVWIPRTQHNAHNTIYCPHDLRLQYVPLKSEHVRGICYRFRTKCRRHVLRNQNELRLRQDLVENRACFNKTLTKCQLRAPADISGLQRPKSLLNLSVLSFDVCQMHFVCKR